MDLNRSLILAHQLLVSGKIDEAEKMLNEILNLDPKNLHVLNNLGNICIEKKNFSKGITFFEKCLEINENFFQALANKGTCHQKLNQDVIALECFEKTIKINPNFIDIYYNIGNCFLKLDRYEEAILNYNKLIEKKPNFINAIFNKALCYEKLENYNSAIEIYKKIIEIKKDFFLAHLHLGNCFKKIYSFENAINIYKKAIEIDTKYKSAAKYNLGCLQLLMGNYEEGWKNYEYRRKEKIKFTKSLEWNGEKNLKNKSIFIYNDQGLGDYIQFCRYLPLLKEFGANIILNTPNKLLPLVRSMNLDIKFVDINEIEQLKVDYYCSIESLPYAFKTSIDSIPNLVPYLKVNEKIKNSWKKNINKNIKNIGIKWTGNQNYLDDNNRSTNLKQLKSLFDLPFNFHSLEIEYSDEDKILKNNIKNLFCYDEKLIGFENTAGLIENLDLVITTDTSVAHLSGALNKSTWVMLSKLPDFRWLTEGKDSPWYPSIKLYRQDVEKDWDSVIKNIKEDLK